MKLITLLFLFLSFSATPVQAMEDFDPMSESFDQLPIQKTEVQRVTTLFWTALSIQSKVKSLIPNHLRSSFTPRSIGGTCEVKAVTKAEGSADACELNDDPERMGKFVYNFSVSCEAGNVQIAICSRENNKLLNQVNVMTLEKIVSEDNPFDLESTM